MPSIIDFTHLSRTGVVIHKVSKIRELPNKVIHKNYVFFVTSRNRTFRFGRNKELVLTNKQKQFWTQSVTGPWPCHYPRKYIYIYIYILSMHKRTCLCIDSILVLPVLDSVRNISPVCALETINFYKIVFACLFHWTNFFFIEKSLLWFKMWAGPIISVTLLDQMSSKCQQTLRNAAYNKSQRFLQFSYDRYQCHLCFGSHFGSIEVRAYSQYWIRSP